MTKFLLIIFLSINIYSFYTVGADKGIAENGKYKSEKNTQHRISEVSLTTYSAFGGALGTIIGLKYYKHKISEQKEYFRKNINYLLVLNLILYLSLYFNFRKTKNDGLY